VRRRPGRRAWGICDGVVFTTGVGGFATSQGTLGGAWAGLAKNAGISGLTPHRLGNTHRSSLHAVGADLRPSRRRRSAALPGQAADGRVAYVRAAEELTAEAAERGCVVGRTGRQRI
jgi:integrase